MPIKIVTDSGSDIPPLVAGELDISVVPLNVQFGSVTYRDGIDIDPDQVLAKLQSDPIQPTTSAPSPGNFAETYDNLCRSSDGIISIHLSSKLSSTYEAAFSGKQLMQDQNCPIEIIDSQSVTMGVGLIVIAAARAARAGHSMKEVIDHVNAVIPAIRAYGLLDTLKFIGRSGRFGKAGALLGSVIPLKPLITVKDGQLLPVGVDRTRGKGTEHLLDIIKSVKNVCEIGIAHSSTDAEILSFSEKLKLIFPEVRTTISKLGPALSVHGGPGAILVAMRQETDKSEVGQAAAEKKQSVPQPIIQSLKDGLLRCKQKEPLPFSENQLIPTMV